MKKLIILIPFLLSGCYQSVNINDIEVANQICQKQGSTVFEIDSYFIGNEKVFCSNREYQWLSSK